MKIIKLIALLLTIIGAINWGLVGFFHFNLVESLLGETSLLSRIVYILVGFSGLISISFINHFTDEM